MPSSTSPSISDIVSDLVVQLTDTIDRYVVERARSAIVSAFGGHPVASSATARGQGVPARTGARRQAEGEKRAPKLIAATTEKLAAHVTKHPRQRIGVIAKTLGTTTKELTLPARKLVAGKRVTTRGQKRATTYFPAMARTAQPAKRQNAKEGVR